MGLKYHFDTRTGLDPCICIWIMLLSSGIAHKYLFPQSLCALRIAIPYMPVVLLALMSVCVEVSSSTASDSKWKACLLPVFTKTSTHVGVTATSLKVGGQQGWEDWGNHSLLYYLTKLSSLLPFTWPHSLIRDPNILNYTHWSNIALSCTCSQHLYFPVCQDISTQRLFQGSLWKREGVIPTEKEGPHISKYLGLPFSKIN